MLVSQNIHIFYATLSLNFVMRSPYLGPDAERMKRLKSFLALSNRAQNVRLGYR